MITTICVLMLISSVLIMFRLAQRSWRSINNTKKPLYAIKSVDDHTSQKMEIEQFASHSTKTELETLQTHKSEDLEVSFPSLEQAFSKRIQSKH